MSSEKLRDKSSGAQTLKMNINNNKASETDSL